jgi:hypothetical protein
MHEHAVFILILFLAIIGFLLAGIRVEPATGRFGRRSKRSRFERLQRYSAKSPVTAVRKRMRDEKVDRAIADAIGFVRNLIAAKKGNEITTDLLLEQLAEPDSILKPAYLKALSLLRVNRSEEMIAAFTAIAGTKMASDFIRLLVRWDHISPDKLASTLLSYQHTMKEIRTTELKRKTEILSDLVFFPVVANVMVVFMNFIIVAYFIGQRDLITQMLL